MKIILILLLIFNFQAFAANTNDAFIKDGNIFLGDQNNSTQITTSGNARLIVLSPDKQMLALVKKTNKAIPSDCVSMSEAKNAEEIWLYNIANKTERLLVGPNFICDNMEKIITTIDDLKFSPDGKNLYFLVPAWTTSDALHVVNIANGEQHFFLPALTFDVVVKGKYQGFLIIQQHRYFIGGGSYDWYWLYSPQGKEEGPFGDDVSVDQKDYLTSEGP